MIHKVGRKSFANIQVVLSFYTDCENWSAMAKGALTVKGKADIRYIHFNLNFAGLCGQDRMVTD